jgi:hypothetical protein
MKLNNIISSTSLELCKESLDNNFEANWEWRQLTVEIKNSAHIHGRTKTAFLGTLALSRTVIVGLGLGAARL